MLASRSAIFKMTNDDYLERKIHSLPRPFLSIATPIQQVNFSKIACEASKSITASGFSITKAIFVGDVAVGKTSLVNRFSHRIFETNYKATIGVDFEVERFNILGVPFNLQIWDTAGQERFQCIAQSYYRGANAIILVFSLCDPSSLNNVKKWLTEALKANNSSPLIFLVGTKRDRLTTPSYVNIERDAICMAAQLNAEYWAVSSKTGDCVNNLFNRIAALTFDVSIQREFQYKDNSPAIGNPMMLGHNINSEQKKHQWKCAGCQI